MGDMFEELKISFVTSMGTGIEGLEDRLLSAKSLRPPLSAESKKTLCLTAVFRHRIVHFALSTQPEPSTPFEIPVITSGDKANQLAKRMKSAMRDMVDDPQDGLTCVYRAWTTR